VPYFSSIETQYCTLLTIHVMIYYLLLYYIRNAGYLCDAHNEILALHKESQECVWLRSMIEHIEEICSLSSE